MTGEAWFYGAILALIGLQVLTLAIAYWRGTGVFAADDGTVDAAGDGAVRCPDCGVENAIEFRFCRRCVAELPAGMDVGRQPVSALGRSSR